MKKLVSFTRKWSHMIDYEKIRVKFDLAKYVSTMLVLSFQDC